MTLMNFYPIDDTIEEGIEMLLFNKLWIDEDYNPNGIRIGFLNGEGWTTAYWCNYHDEFHTRDSIEDDEHFNLNKAIDQIPTHYCKITNINIIN